MNSATNRSDAVQAFVMHHVRNSKEWSLGGNLRIHLPRYLSVDGVMVLLAALLLIVIFGRFYRKRDRVPHGLTNALELFVVFIRDQIAVPYLGPQDGLRMTPLFCSLFFFILTMNLMGLVPFLHTATANINVTGALALVSLAFMIVGAIYRNGLLGFLKGFMPHGVPWPILLVLVPIEFLGLFIKALALTIRLFANMLAGHIVVLSLLGLVVTFGYMALPAIVMAVGVDIIEVGVSFLQAYIFTLLSAIFIGQRYSPSH